MTILINGKQRRVKRPPTIDGMGVDEFIRKNADPIWLHQNEMWEHVDQDEEEGWMEKFDTSCGLTKKEIDIIKYNVKNKIGRTLPILPEAVETTLFLQGRDAWTYKWGLTGKNDKLPVDQISLEVIVKLKKEFHDFLKCKAYKFLCSVKLQEDIYHPKINLKKAKLGV